MKAAKRGMKWHTVLIWYGLFFRAISEAWNGFVYMLSAISDDGTRLTLPEKSTLIVFGLALFFFAIYAVYTRFELARFRRRAPLELTILTTMDFSIRLASALVNTLVLHQSIAELITPLAFWNTFWPILCLLINYVYYKKRADLFVH